MKQMSIKKFCEEGYLQEVNRRILHPLGLALQVVTDESGNETLYGVWDARDDPEGIIFDGFIAGEKSFKENIEAIDSELDAKRKVREKLFGFYLQPHT